MSLVEFLTTVMDLKEEKRTGWVDRGIDDAESVADHTFGTAFLALLLGGGDRAVKMALVHDVHEAISGDIRSGGLSDEEREEKAEEERAAFEELLRHDGIDTGEMAALWEEYEARRSDTARFVKDMDVLDAALQAYIYARDERYADAEAFFQEHDGMREFFDGTRGDLHTEEARRVFDRICERYEECETRDAFELLDHTAEVGFRARGRSLEEAFENAGRALFQVMTDIDELATDVEVELEVASEDLEALLYDFVDHLIYLSEAENLVFRDFDLRIETYPEQFKIEGVARGQEIGGAMRRQDVKAATYSDMRVEEADGGWVIEMTLDV